MNAIRRPESLFRIHDTTPIYTRRPGQKTWTVFRIARKTANSVFIDTPDGPLQLDRIALERTGKVKRQGNWYVLWGVLQCLHSRQIEERIAS